MDKQQPILSALADADPEVAATLVSRREAMRRGAVTSAAVAAGLRLGTVSTALAALSSSAFGQSRLPAVVNGVLNYALVLEELEAQFYVRGVGTPNLIPQQDRAIFTTLRDHEVAHVQFLRQTLGAAARPSPSFDFTGGKGSQNGPYRDVFTNYETFKAVSQAFEDTGVRAYKGQAPALIPYKDVLTAALTIHSVEARHASEVRRLRGNFTDVQPFYQGWITENLTDVPGAQAVYAGEENVVHAGIDVTTITPVPRDSITEAWDEPLTQAQVLAIIDPFLVG